MAAPGVRSLSRKIGSASMATAFQRRSVTRSCGRGHRVLCQNKRPTKCRESADLKTPPAAPRSLEPLATAPQCTERRTRLRAGCS